ncbi:MAG: DNA polymerase III subunit epsilon, partial [Chloroflexi bacterium]
MNRQGVEILLVLGGIFLFLLGTGLAWLLAPYMSREQFIMAELLVVFLLIGVGFAASLFYEAYATNLRWLAEAIRLVATVNPAHRVKPEGPPVVRQLVEAVNDLAERFQTMQENQSRQIQQAQAELENERNRLAALMSDLTAGVLVCNMEGQILLYNNQARQLLTGSTPTAGQGVGAWVGLGRSVFGLIDRHAINHMLEELAYRQQKDYQNPLAHFVTTAANGQLIRARMAPIWDQQQAMTGFVLTLEDITGRHLSSLRRDALLQSLTEGIRASLSNIRTAIETIQQYPNMTQDRLDRLHRVIADEALALSLKLDEATGKYAADLKATWELAEMMSSDLLWAIQRRFEDKLGLNTSLEGADENLWLKVDSYLLVQALQALARRLQEQFQLRQVTLRLSRSGQMAALDLAWPDDGHIDTETMWLWQNDPLTTDDDMPAITLQEVAEHHGGEVWFQVDTAGKLAFFRILLPTTQPHQPRLIQPTQESRPEYYDFDLFDRSRSASELDRQSLADLTYTVFDTETTGLNPSAGDEIISISAVRIV